MTGTAHLPVVCFEVGCLDAFTKVRWTPLQVSWLPMTQGQTAVLTSVSNADHQVRQSVGHWGLAPALYQEAPKTSPLGKGRCVTPFGQELFLDPQLEADVQQVT